jgi:hypothetical protein
VIDELEENQQEPSASFLQPNSYNRQLAALKTFSTPEDDKAWHVLRVNMPVWLVYVDVDVYLPL